jgi:hypothetical protein
MSKLIGAFRYNADAPINLFLAAQNTTCSLKEQLDNAV